MSYSITLFFYDYAELRPDGKNNFFMPAGSAPDNSKLFAPHYISGINGACFEGAFKTLKQMSGAQALKVLKSWTNGWATSHRMHEDHALDCVLGCSGCRDSLSHYLHCPHMYAFQKYIFGSCQTSDETRISDDPLI